MLSSARIPRLVASLPDFRGPEGVWTKNPGGREDGDAEHYVADPEVRKRAWRPRRPPAWTAEPNAGHRALVDLERRGQPHALVTQNVDGLHLAAGTRPSGRRDPRHDARGRCASTAASARRWSGRSTGCGPARTTRLPHCGGILKSATISFGQSLVPEDLRPGRARPRGPATCCSPSASTLAVYPVAGVVPLAKRAGARVVIVNAEPTEMDDLADVVLRGSISEVLPAIVGGNPPPADRCPTGIG